MEKSNTSPLEEYLCKNFHVNTMYDIQWYPNNVIRTSEVARTVSFTQEIELSGDNNAITFENSKEINTTALQPKKLFQNTPIDLDNVCMQSILVRGYNNPNDCHMGLRCNTLPRELTKEVAIFDRTKAAAHGRSEVAGLRMQLYPNTAIKQLQDNEMVWFLNWHQDIPSLHSDWAKCTGLVSEKNMDNYIVHLPRNVCIAQTAWAKARFKNPHKQTLQVWEAKKDGQEPLKELHPIHHWVVIPPDHIMATYCYGPRSMLDARNIECKTIRCQKGNLPPKTFFVMSDVCFKHMKEMLVKLWLDRRDMRPLGKIGFQAVHLFEKEKEKVQKNVWLNTSVSYIGWPKYSQEEIDAMVPTCNQGLVSLVYSDTFKEPEMKRMLKTMLPKK